MFITVLYLSSSGSLVKIGQILLTDNNTKIRPRPAQGGEEGIICMKVSEIARILSPEFNYQILLNNFELFTLRLKL